MTARHEVSLMTAGHTGCLNSGIAGIVTAKSGDTLTVKGSNGATYTVDADEAKVRGTSAAMTLSSIEVGDRVLIQGVVDGSSVVATLIIDAKKNAPASK